MREELNREQRLSEWGKDGRRWLEASSVLGSKIATGGEEVLRALWKGEGGMFNALGLPDLRVSLVENGCARCTLRIPLHLTVRLHFSRQFSLFSCQNFDFLFPDCFSYSDYTGTIWSLCLGTNWSCNTKFVLCHLNMIMNFLYMTLCLGTDWYTLWLKCTCKTLFWYQDKFLQYTDHEFLIHDCMSWYRLVHNTLWLKWFM